MQTLNFKNWLMELVQNSQVQQQDLLADPDLKNASVMGKNAARVALQKGMDPVQAARAAILKSNIPTNKLGSVLPTNPKDKDPLKN